MGEVYNELMEFVRKPAVADVALDVVLCAVPIWAAVMIGMLIGWYWRPRWTVLLFLGLRSKLRFVWTGLVFLARFVWTAAPPGFGARRLWFAFTALSAFSVLGRLWSKKSGNNNNINNNNNQVTDEAGPQVGDRSVEINGEDESNGNCEIEGEIVTEKDLEHLLHLLDGKIRDSAWQNQMERTTPNMLYQAWRYEPEDGPIVFKSRTVFEDATPELVKDFFWDDEFRPKWDAMLAHFKILEDSNENGTMIVQWIKKFPFFCSDREYIIARRIWEQGRTFYCVTKGVPYASLPKREKPRRVELYFSSWRIRPVESRKDGQLSSCEVTLIHYEDMGIPKDVAKLGVRHGMWGAVKKLHSGMRAYQQNYQNAPSRCAELAQVMTKFPTEGSLSVLDFAKKEDLEIGGHDSRGERKGGGVDWRLIVIGGTVAVACGLHTGLIGKALFFGAARRLAKK